MNIQYEFADETDIEAIFKLNKELIDKYEDISKINYEKVLTWVHKKIEDHVSEYTRIKSNEDIAGYYYFHETQEKMEIDDLYILPSYQNQGIGTMVMKKCISETVLPIFLYVFLANEKAMALYKRLGFQITETIKETRCIMQRG